MKSSVRKHKTPITQLILKNRADGRSTFDYRTHNIEFEADLPRHFTIATPGRNFKMLIHECHVSEVRIDITD